MLWKASWRSVYKKPLAIFNHEPLTFVGGGIGTHCAKETDDDAPRRTVIAGSTCKDDRSYVKAEKGPFFVARALFEAGLARITSTKVLETLKLA